MPERGAVRGEAVEIIAHRGYSATAPENTLAAIEAAITAGADAVEFDLHVTRDGVAVLFHDETLERTTGRAGLLAETSLAELRGLDAGAWFAASFTGEPVPSLDDALAGIGTRLGRIYPEVKGYGRERDLDRMVDLVVERGLIDTTVFISMDWHALDRMRARHEALRIGYIVEKRSRARDGLARAAGDPLALVDFRASLLLEDPDLCSQAGVDGVDLAVWTVDDPEEASSLLALGVCRITTNRVSALLTWKASL